MVNFFTVKKLKVVNKLIVITGKLIRCHVVKKFVDIHTLLENLERHYETRYPENKRQSDFMFTGELDQIDELIIHLSESLPIPDEIKYGYLLYSKLFIGKENGLPPNKWPEEKWLLYQNYALEKKYKYIIQRHEAIKGILCLPKEAPSLALSE